MDFFAANNQYETPIVPVSELRVGMYVILTSWMDHPSLKSHFLIESKSQIKQIVESGYRNVRIDPSKSIIMELAAAAKNREPERDEIISAAQWRPEELVSPEFGRLLRDRGADPVSKAAAVKEFSLGMMKKLYEDPTAGNIAAVKSGIYDIVEMFLDEDETANELIKQSDYNNNPQTHSVNVGMLSILLAKRVLDVDSHNFHELGVGFFLHDIGKVRIDPKIINSRGRLNKAEWEQMKKHPEFGFQFLRAAGQLSEECWNIVLQHHERVDGKGYPQGLARDEINLYARICSIADVYDALTSTRTYRKRLKPFDALIVMRNEMLGHIQKDIFEHLVYLLHGSMRE
ncbi:MAG: HD domain-containing phosphohydrolase [Syntrophaceae bacterium]